MGLPNKGTICSGPDVNLASVLLSDITAMSIEWDLMRNAIANPRRTMTATILLVCLSLDVCMELRAVIWTIIGWLGSWEDLKSM